MKVGIVCDLSFNIHIGIKNYFYAIKNIFNDVKLVNSVFDLDDIEILFIGNEHFVPHRKIWENVLFQKKCNLNNIKVVIFSCEKIHNSYFKHNIEIQERLNLFENLTQYAIDAEDISILNTKLLRGCLSKNFINIEKNENKLDKCAFLGNVDCVSYSERKETIKQLENDIEIVFPKKQENWEDYIKELSNYRFVFSPLGNANALNLKFYEILLAGSIPIQQVRDNTLSYYSIEKQFNDCIFFEKVDEIKEKINMCQFEKSKNNIWLEDQILSFLLEDKIIKDL